MELGEVRGSGDLPWGLWMGTAIAREGPDMDDARDGVSDRGFPTDGGGVAGGGGAVAARLASPAGVMPSGDRSSRYGPGPQGPFQGLLFGPKLEGRERRLPCWLHRLKIS